jgi:putative glycosyltransferase (TIGR04372 family)
MLKPFVHIRFGQLESARLGVLATIPEVYLCERDAEMHPRKCLDLWYHYDHQAYMLPDDIKRRSVICNQQLNTMWERIIHVWELARVLDRLNRMLPFGSDNFIVKLAHSPSQYSVLQRFPTHLTFTDLEERRGLSELRELGVEPGAQFVCIHGRDSAYLDRARPMKSAIHGGWSWQDLRDMSIENYAPAAEKLAELGYFVIRMGKYVKEPLNCDNPRVIDYATQCQSDFMDVFLPAHCTFFICQNSGMANPPLTFRRPLAFVNVFPFGQLMHCWYSNGVCIPKKYYSEVQGRFLTFREVLDLGLGEFTIKNPRHKGVHDALGLKIVENTPEEISELAIEMHQRLCSTFTWSEEDQELQCRLLSILRSSPDIFSLQNETPRIRIGKHFLRTNRELLD